MDVPKERQQAYFPKIKSSIGGLVVGLLGVTWDLIVPRKSHPVQRLETIKSSSYKHLDCGPQATVLGMSFATLRTRRDPYLDLLRRDPKGIFK